MKTGDSTQTPIPVTVDKGAGSAFAEIGSGQLASEETIVTMPVIPNVDTYTVGIPVPDLSTSGVQGSLTIETDKGNISVPSNMLTGLETPESIVIWYIDGLGNVITVPNGRYDALTGMVTFSTTHFSDYAAAFNKVDFKDVAAGAWYEKAVDFIVAREITKGTGGNNFSSESKLTRAELIVMMMRAYGIEPDLDPADNFSDGGDSWYTGYLAAAKRRGISAGVGDNMYAPDKPITRQEMFTLLYNALNVIGQLPQGGSGKTLADFTDMANIASWAKEAMELLVKTGTIAGSESKLIPTATASRAEMAQVLYILFMRQ